MMSKANISEVISIIKDFDYEMLDDSEWDEFKVVDPSDKQQLLKLFNQVVVPEYGSMNNSSQERMKLSLHKLISEDSDYHKILGSVEMPFEPIENPREFFLNLWLALFKDPFSS